MADINQSPFFANRDNWLKRPRPMFVKMADHNGNEEEIRFDQVHIYKALGYKIKK